VQIAGHGKPMRCCAGEEMKCCECGVTGISVAYHYDDVDDRVLHILFCPFCGGDVEAELKEETE